MPPSAVGDVHPEPRGRRAARGPVESGPPYVASTFWLASSAWTSTHGSRMSVTPVGNAVAGARVHDERRAPRRPRPTPRAGSPVLSFLPHRRREVRLAERPAPCTRCRRAPSGRASRSPLSGMWQSTQVVVSGGRREGARLPLAERVDRDDPRARGRTAGGSSAQKSGVFRYVERLRRPLQVRLRPVVRRRLDVRVAAGADEARHVVAAEARDAAPGGERAVARRAGSRDRGSPRTAASTAARAAAARRPCRT